MSATPTGEAVAVVGAGWGGLAAAVELVRRGHRVVLLEAAAEAGGRARTVVLDGRALDNGQHLLLGAYRQTLALVRALGVAPERVLVRRRLELALDGPGERFRLRLGRGPAALALPLALARCRGLGAADRARALRGAAALRRPPASDTDVDTWLAACGQPEVLRARLWRPLCLAALNVAAPRASAAVFARVLREAFGRADGADLLLPRTDLGGVLPRPATAWLRARGADVRLGTRVRALARAPGGGWRLETATGTLDAGRVVLAAGPAASARLLPAGAACDETRARLGRLGAEPIATVYLDYGPGVALERPLLGRLDGPAQWLFDRGLSGHPGVIAAVVSGRGEHTGWSRDALGDAVAAQLARAFPTWPAPRRTVVLREKRATFDCRPGSDALRGPVRGPLPGLWFAGDHVATGLPATLEGAIRAGLDCAAALDRQEEHCIG